jgi:hypothetical protein
MKSTKIIPENLEEILDAIDKNGLNEEQAINLMKSYYLYNNIEIKPGSFHEIKYKNYDLDYFIKQIQKGALPLEIVNKIIDECEKYSRQQIANKHLMNVKN